VEPQPRHKPADCRALLPGDRRGRAALPRGGLRAARLHRSL